MGTYVREMCERRKGGWRELAEDKREDTRRKEGGNEWKEIEEARKRNEGQEKERAEDWENGRS